MFLAIFGIPQRDGSVVSVFVSIPILMFSINVGMRLFLKAAFPSLRQALVHPRNATQQTLMKIIMLLYLSMSLFLYLDNGNTPQSLMSIGLTILGLYALVVFTEIFLYMVKDERVQHPFT